METEKQKLWAKELSAVTTVSEACQMYKIVPTTLKRWLDEGKVMGVRSAGTWLISLGSLQDYAGLPEYIVDQELNSTGLHDLISETIN